MDVTGNNSTPYACGDCQASFYDYLDDLLTESEARVLRDHLDDCPDCRIALVQYQSAQSAVSNLRLTTPVPPEVETASFWARIQQQLDEDRTMRLPCSYDQEFISAYLDREALPEAGQVLAFERHLNDCPPCQERLGDFTELSTRVRHYACQVEANCALEVTREVMRRFKAEGGGMDNVIPFPGTELKPHCSEMAHETLSAYFDQALGQKEIIAVNRHVEQCGECRVQLQQMAGVSGLISERNQRLEADAPDFLPAIRAELEKVVPLTRSRRWTTRWLAVPVAAAAVVLMLVSFSGNAFLNQPLREQAGERPAIAAVDMAGSRQTFHTDPSMEGRMLAAVPSAEEYLFQVSEQAVPDEVEPAMLGMSK
jgi:predicted anti-sigma-YlaC factor YlaD